MASFEFNGEYYELPKKTLAIVKKEDLLYKNNKSLEDAYKKQFDYVNTVLGAENVEKIFESTDINDIDLSLLTYICNEIDNAYMEKIYDQQRNLAEKLVNNKAVDKAIKFGETANYVKTLKK